MEYLRGVSLAFNILCMASSLYYIDKIANKLKCDQIWISFFLAALFRIVVNLMRMFDPASTNIESIFSALNGVFILSAFMSLHHAIFRTVNHAEGRLQK